MKNLYYLLVAICLLMPAPLFAQMQQQQAIVKTHARQRLDGTTSKCEYVSSAIVSIKNGAQVVSDNRGRLSFNVDAKSCYYVSSAYKKGYQVTDMSVLTNGHYYSGNEPLIIYMQNIVELEQERASYKRVIRSHYQNEINKRQDVIDSLRRHNLATIEELRALQQEIDKAWEDAENVVSDMTERYLLVDFDYATDTDKRISTLILNGKLDEAKREVNPESVEEKVRQVKIAQIALDNARDDAARYCMHLVDIYILENKRDSVAHYLDLRASLDRANVDWQLAAGLYMSDYLCDYSRALSICEPALKYSLDHYGDMHSITALLYNDIGTVYDDQGNYSEALTYFLKSLEIFRKVLGDEHVSTAASYNNIGNVYSNLGNYSAALEYYFKSLEIRKKVLGEEHVDTATSYGNIGNVYYAQGNYSETLKYHLKSLEILKKVLGEEHINTATSYNNIGVVYSDLGNYSAALEYYFNSLEIKIKVLGEEHVSTAASYNNIGNVHSNQGNYSAALECHFKSLEIFKKVLGDEHKNTAGSYNNIGMVYSDQGNYSAALEYYFKSLEIYKKVLDDEHKDTAGSYNNIGSIYVKQGNYSEALEYYLKSLEILKKVLDDEHINIASSYYNIGGVYYLQGLYSEALEYLTKAEAAFSKIYGEEHEVVQQLREGIQGIKNLL